MALTKCHECGKDVSTEAKNCPSCGAKVVKPKEPKKQTSPLVLAIVGIAGLGIVALNAMESLQEGAPSTADRDRAEASRHDIGRAEVTCKTAFEKNAKNPDSIDWLRQERQFEFTNVEKTTALSIQPLRGKNSLDATIKSAVECKLDKKDGDWRLISMKERN